VDKEEAQQAENANGELSFSLNSVEFRNFKLKNSTIGNAGEFPTKSSLVDDNKKQEK
jgi:hypothetical protein